MPSAALIKLLLLGVSLVHLYILIDGATDALLLACHTTTGYPKA